MSMELGRRLLLCFRERFIKMNATSRPRRAPITRPPMPIPAAAPPEILEFVWPVPADVIADCPGDVVVVVFTVELGVVVGLDVGGVRLDVGGDCLAKISLPMVVAILEIEGR